MNVELASPLTGTACEHEPSTRPVPTSEQSLHGRYRALVELLESQCPVSAWRAGDIHLWPLARQDLFLDVCRQSGSETASRPRFLARAAATLAVPLTNAWKSRRDLAHHVARPRRADAIFLGDGVSLDQLGGAWRDRFGDPIVTALDRMGRSSFVMQSGNLTRLPWARPTFSANVVAAQGALRAALAGGPEPDMPGHAEALTLLREQGIAAPSLTIERLRRRARVVNAQADAFRNILRRVQPSFAFVVGHYAGLGPAFALACRRQEVLCTDIQHCPRDTWHRGYDWPNAPSNGYSTLPGLFWTWSESNARNVRRWSDEARPWHGAIVGGQTQIEGGDAVERERLWFEAVARTGDWQRYEREILVALQPIGGRRHVWAQLAEQIRHSPSTWRWWIRRHPASNAEQDREYADLLAIHRAGVVIGEAAQAPLPALLGHMHAQVSLASGSAAEAAMFGVPAFFLDSEARDTFPALLSTGKAILLDVSSLVPAIALSSKNPSGTAVRTPPLDATLYEVQELARDYAELCRVNDCQTA